MLSLGQLVKGKLDSYRVVEKISEYVFIAAATRKPQKVVLKSIEGHWRLQNERDVLRHFQTKIPALRPLLDEVEDETAAPAVVSRHLDNDIDESSTKQRLTRQEIKDVARKVLDALRTPRRELRPHWYFDVDYADIKPRNILVNHGTQGQRFSEVQLADLGGTVPAESEYALEGSLTGTSVFRAPEVHLGLSWGTPSDIWSFGVTLINLLWAFNFHIFQPPLGTPDDQYDKMVLIEQNRYFGPFPVKYHELLDLRSVKEVVSVIKAVPGDKRKPFQLLGDREVCAPDKAFLLKIMKLDPRDRPTAQALLDDEWFTETSERTIGWYSREAWGEIERKHSEYRRSRRRRRRIGR